MHPSRKKIGLLSLIALVIGSQVGSGALSSPAIFAKYGLYSIYSWLFAGIGAVSLAYVFSKLSSLFPYTGGPHVYIQKAFNFNSAFWVGWTYWMVSWISTVVVLIACIAYFSKAINLTNTFQITLIGLVVWLIINIINTKSVVLSGKIETWLTAVKVLFFAVFTIIPLYYFNSGNLLPYDFNMDFSSSVSAALWGFIGLEVATTPAESVENPSVNIPKAVLFGTILVAVIYMLANIAAIGIVEHSELVQTAAPYDLISQKIFGSSLITNILAFILCLGSLNAWVLAAGQIALGLSNDKILPKVFGKLKNDVPYVSIWLSALGVAIIWIACSLFGYENQISVLIDALTPVFILVYLGCSLAFLKYAKGFMQMAITVIGLVFCAFLLYFTNLLSVIVILSIVLSGVPFYIYSKKYLLI